MENRSIFALDGITGMLIATALVLTLLAVFTTLGLGIQQSKAADHYVIEDAKSIKMFADDTTNKEAHNG